jgi:hypothetical protein
MAGLLDEEDLMPFFGNPNIKRQGSKAKALAAKRDVNTLPDPKTFAAIQGLLGTRPDQMGFSVLNPEYESIMNVANPAFAAGTALGVAPMAQALGAGKAAMAAGRAGERFAEKVVPQIMERGGIGADILQGLAQGTRSNVYLPNTPSNRNPLVGTRYETQQLPGIVARRPVNYDEMRGGSIMTYPTDILSRNTLVTSVSDIPLGNNSFVTPGGLMYMMDENNIAKKIGYASNQAAATSQNNRALQAIEENLKMGGTGRIFMAPHTMPPGGENFSTGPTQGLLSLIDVTNPSPSLLNTISDQIREATVKGVKGKYKDFVGLNDPMAKLQLLTGEGLKAGSAGDLRKVFVDKMSNVAAEKGLDFNYPDLQRAMFDPNVMNRPSFWMGDAIYEALPKLGIQPGTHGAYGYDMPGIFFGNTRGAPINEFMQPVYNKILPTQMNKPGSGYKSASLEDLFGQIQMPGDIPAGRTYADPNQLTRGKLSTAGENISMFMDDAQIKRLKKLLGEE